MERLNIEQLFIEYQVNPLGIDTPHPLFGWRFLATRTRCGEQRAYRIAVATTEQGLRDGVYDAWDSGRVEGRRSVGIPYEGAPLRSRQIYYSSVTVWDQEGRVSASPTATWEMALLAGEDWRAEWIGPSRLSKGDWLPRFRREFILPLAAVGARIYVSGLGHYELRLNGKRVGDRVLDPGWTNYDKTVLYSVYDVTGLLHEGTNALGILLGNGFYNVIGGRYTKFVGSFGPPKCLVQLEAELADGGAFLLATDETWREGRGPITFSSIYGGEDEDARLEESGWDSAGFEENGRWHPARRVEAPKGTLRAQSAPPLAVMKRFEPISIEEPRPGLFVFDFGRNFSGWMEVTLQGAAGDRVTFTPAEVLKDGLADQSSSGSPTTFTYTLRSDGVESWSPRFSYTGFRYLQAEGATPRGSANSETRNPVILRIEGLMIYPRLSFTGSFASSNPLLNGVHEIIDYAILSNTKSVFTDCPHREKLGWLEQVHLVGPGIVYGYDVERLFEKTLDDIRDAQLPDGMVPTTAPEYVVFSGEWGRFRHSVAWGATYILIAWELLEKYGNARPIVRHYQGLKAYIHYLVASSEGLIAENGLGDWYDIGPRPPGFSQNTPVGLADTAVFHQIVLTMARIASLLGKDRDVGEFADLADRIRAAATAVYYHPETAQFAEGSQTANAMALVSGLAPETDAPRIRENLVADILSRGYHTTAGEVGHRYVLLTLHNARRDDIIFEMSRRTDHPSYGYQVVHGATTLTEAWDGPTAGHSQNHFMLGHLEEWLYRGLAGIEYQFDPTSQTFRVELHPAIVEGLAWVRAHHELPVGRIEVEWERTGEAGVELRVLIPPNVEATVSVPARCAKEVTVSGKNVGEDSDLEVVGYRGDLLLVRAPAGEYRFSSLLPAKPAVGREG